MTIYYLDASAIAKRYLHEPGTRWINSLSDSAVPCRLTSVELVTVEVICALTRAQRERRISVAARDRSLTRFIADVRAMLSLLAVSQQTWDLAGQLAIRYPLRAYDAIHLASVQELTAGLTQVGLPAPIFVSADTQLLQAARAEGLAIENPNDHE